jgi:hypothetical protein
MTSSIADMDSFCLGIQRELHEITAVGVLILDGHLLSLNHKILAPGTRATIIHLQYHQSTFRPGRLPKRRRNCFWRDSRLPWPDAGHAYYPENASEELAASRASNSWGITPHHQNKRFRSTALWHPERLYSWFVDPRVRGKLFILLLGTYGWLLTILFPTSIIAFVYLEVTMYMLSETSFFDRCLGFSMKNKGLSCASPFHLPIQ